MTTRHRLARWCALLTIILGHGLLDAGRAPAQAPPGGDGTTPTKHYTKHSIFDLPVGIKDGEEATLQAVRLYVKQGAADWQLVETAPPTQKKLRFEAQQDGEYWFSLVSVDRAGQANPPDVRREPPMLMVVVDRQPPVIEVQTATGPGGEALLRCTLKDANPDYQSLKASYRGPDQQWHPLDAMPGVRGVFRVPSPDVLTSTVRVSAEDLAHNASTREVNLNEAQAKQPGPDLPTPRPIGALALEQATPVVPPAPPRAVAPAEVPPPRPAPANASSSTCLPAPGRPVAAAPIAVERTSYSGGGSAALAQGTVPRQLLNTTRVALDYRLDQVGPSGVGKVEVYLTSDEGKTWTRLCEDPDRRSPAELLLPGEGLFGVRLVVTNGNGFGGTPPGRGDAPTCWIEVDQTPPHCQLHEVDPVVHDGALEIRWSATDKNLGPEPVSLYYAAKKEGPWMPVARGLRNDGVYRWTFPRDVGGQFFLRLEVVDQVGNVGRCEPVAPVVLDMTEPRALVVGVTPVMARP